MKRPIALARAALAALGATCVHAQSSNWPARSAQFHAAEFKRFGDIIKKNHIHLD